MANDKKNPLSGAFHDPEPPKDAEAAKKSVEPAKTADIGKPAAAPAKAEEVKKPAAPDKAADTAKDKAAPAKPEAEKKSAEPEKAADAAKPAAAPAKADEVKKPAPPEKAADTAKDKAAPAQPGTEKKTAEPEKAADDGKPAAAPAKAEEVKKPTEAGKAPADGKAAEEKRDALDPKHMQMPMGVAEMDKVTIMPLADIHRFEGHPFKVEDNKDMWDLVESIKQFGVMEPAVVLPRKESGYEVVSGHRRQRACQLAGLTSMPVIVRNLDRDEATITMVDANPGG